MSEHDEPAATSPQRDPGGRPIWPLVAAAVVIAVALFVTGIRWSQSNEVVVYAALDAEFSKPIFRQIEQRTDVRVLGQFDTESTKTVGLTNRIIAEAERPRCDVFWNNEILNTLRLQRQGLLDVYHSPAAENYPAMFRSPEGYWHGFAARARVLIVNTELLGSREPPDSLGDLVDPRWRDQAGIAKPLFGTTATHAACLFSAWGPQKARQFFRDMKANGVKVLAGNKQVAQDVAAGRLTFGLTDTDDAIIELEAGRPVTIVYPDQGEGQDGTLFIPNTLAVIRGGPNPAAARRLVDALLAEDVESALARGPSAQIPLNPRVTTSPRVESPQTIRAMEIDFEVAADQWDTSAAFLRDLFATNE